MKAFKQKIPCYNQDTRDLYREMRLVSSEYHSLEDGCNIVQLALKNISYLRENISTVKENLIFNLDYKADSVISECDNKISELKYRVDSLCTSVRYKSTPILNGNYGLCSSNENINVIDVDNWKDLGQKELFKIKIFKTATRSYILSNNTLSHFESNFEDEITIVENGKRIKLNIYPSDSLMCVCDRFNQQFYEHDIDLICSVDRKHDILIQHKQHGSRYKFWVSSRYTNLFSKNPSVYEYCNQGDDLKVMLNNETVKSNGRYVYTSGMVKNMPSIALYIKKVESNEFQFSIQSNPVTIRYHMEGLPYRYLIRINSCHSHHLGRGFENSSGFENLADVEIKSMQNVYDAINILKMSEIQLNNQIQVLRVKLDEILALSQNVLLQNPIFESDNHKHKSQYSKEYWMVKVMNELY